MSGSPHQNNTGVICVFAVLLALQPLANPDLWWNIARGQTVLDGETQPSSALLMNHEVADSDWLRGTVSSLVYDFGGTTGLMLLKLGAAILLAMLLCRPTGNSPWRLPSAICLLLAVCPTLAPSAMTTDVLAIFTTALLLRQGRLIAFALLVVAWSNFSVGAIWAIPVAICIQSVASGSKVSAQKQLLVSIGCLCLTPRGVYGALDMLRLLAPQLFTDSVFLEGSGFGQFALTTSTLSAVIHCVFVVAHPRVTKTQRLMITIAVLCGISNDRQLPAAASLSAAVLLSAFQNSAVTFRDPSSWKAAVVPRLAAIVLGLCVVWNLTGDVGDKGERLGWGIADSLDLRFAQRDFSEHASTGIRAHCTDSTSAGMLLMTCPSARVLYHPEAAIVSGRIAEFELLNHDLETSRKAGFQRLNKTPGGWWHGLINQDITLLVISPDRKAMLQALEPTIWKQLSLDGPVLPYAQTGIPQFTRQIVETRSHRELIDYGPWQHQLSSQSTSPSHIDLAVLLIGRPDTRRDLQQAQIFRAMGLPVGAVRTLLPMLPDNPDAREAFIQLQKEFAWEEHLHTGTISELRRRILNSQSPKIQIPGIPPDELDSKSAADDVISDESIRLYLSGDPIAAIPELTKHSADSLFAKHVLFRDGGQPEYSSQAAEQLQMEFPRHPLTAIIQATQNVE